MRTFGQGLLWVESNRLEMRDQRRALCLWCVGGAVVMTLSKSYNGREEVGRTPLDQQAEGGHFPRQCYVEFIRSHLLVALISMMVAITKLTIEN